MLEQFGALGILIAFIFSSVMIAITPIIWVLIYFGWIFLIILAYGFIALISEIRNRDNSQTVQELMIGNFFVTAILILLSLPFIIYWFF